MHKTYVLDTNVLLHNPEALFAFQDNHVVIPLTVIEEIDSQKKRQDEIGRNARVVSRQLDALRSLGRLSEGVPMPSGGKLTIELNHSSIINFPKGLDPEKHDNRILAVAFNLSNAGQGKVILVTKDLNLRIKADVVGVRSEDFYNDKVDYDHLYSGVVDKYLSARELDRFYQDGGVEVIRLSTAPESILPSQVPREFVTVGACTILPWHAVASPPCRFGQLGHQGPEQGAKICPRTAQRRSDKSRHLGRPGRNRENSVGPCRRIGKSPGRKCLLEAAGHPARHPDGRGPGRSPRDEGRETEAMDAAHI